MSRKVVEAWIGKVISWLLEKIDGLETENAGLRARIDELLGEIWLLRKSLKGSEKREMKYKRELRRRLDELRSICPFCAKRKTSLHFGSDAGAEMSAVYHSIVSTLRMQVRSVWEFFGKYFRGVATGEVEYLSLLGLGAR